MPLKRQLIDVPLSTGLNQKSDPKALEPSGAIQMLNCVRLKSGQIRKRFGHTSLVKTTFNTVLPSIAASVRGGSFKGAPWMSDGSVLYGYSDNAAQWTVSDLLPEGLALDRIGISTTATAAASIGDCDQAYGGGYLYAAYSALVGGTQRILVVSIDAATGDATFASSLVSGTVFGPHVIVCGSSVIVSWVNGAAIQAIAFNPGLGGAITSVVNIVTGLPAGGEGQNGTYDIQPVTGDPTRFCVAYEKPNGTFVIQTFNPTTLASIASTTVAEPAGLVKAAFVSLKATNGEQFVLLYSLLNNNTGIAEVHAFAVSDPFATIAGPITVFAYPTGSAAPGRVGLERNTSTTYAAIWGSSTTAGESTRASWVMCQALSVSGIVITTTGGTFYTGGILLWSRPMLVGQTVYAAVYTPSALQGTYFLAAFDGVSPSGSGVGLFAAARPVVTVSPRLAKSIPAQFSISRVSPSIVAPTVLGASVVAFAGYLNTSASHPSLFTFPCDLASPLRHGSAELGDLEAINAGVPSVYDGQNVTELSFLQFVEMSAPSAGGAASGNLSAGTYLYSVIYEEYDTRGQAHRSAQGPIVSVVAVNTGSATLTIPCILFSSRRKKFNALQFQPTVVASIYRSQANGTTLNFVASVTMPTTKVTPTTTTNDNTVSFTDTASDTSIAGNALIYTTGGVLSSFNPASARVAIQHRNRWWLAGGDDPTQVWPSRQITPGESPGFNEALNLFASGPVRALASLDDKLILFVQRGSHYGIEFLSGDGPTDLGTQSDWSPIQPIPTAGVGAIDPRSVVVGPFGVAFRSPIGGPNGSGGIFVLTRDLQVQYLSGPVEDTLQSFPIITSAVVHPNAGRVYFTCAQNDAAPTFGQRLVWDYVNGGTWSMDTMNDYADRGTTSAGARCAWVANTSTQGNAYHWATLGGQVYRETNGIGAGGYMDGSNFVQMSYTSAWIKPSLAGFARFWRVVVSGQRAEAFQVTVNVTYDFDPSYVETSSWTDAQIATFTRLPNVDLQVTAGNQKAKAIRVTLIDSAPVSGLTTGQGPFWQGLTFEVGVKDGRYPNLPQAQKN